ncbi:hypothetical protein GCM10010172_35240 [Paractinoplanes ferrugineus]|uniref:Uncharacterized protein n=1 Tax=Paractinoplanes ferrugineus TaxID=113564 RepID=A0A919J8F8_9ACTN|nr:hypothetical protein Afe05nite_86060 [Actinoplanes ferrugineus]
MTVPQPAANWYRTRKHWTRDLAPYVQGGHHGHAACSTESNSVQVWDQDAMNALDEQYFRTKKTVVANLPECKKCYRILAKEATR